MIYRKCKCGKAERWDTGEVVHPCQGCEECRTTFASNPKDHLPLEPHDWKPQYDQNTGKLKRRRCRLCHQSESMAVKKTDQ